MSVEVAVQPIQLTDNAVKQIKTILTEQKIPIDYGLRIGVKGGGCSGFSYILGFDEPKEGDEMFDINSV